MTTLYSPSISRALEKAAQAHQHQTRKGTTSPYISHPAMVGFIVQRAGLDDETVAAAILHDVVEDADVPLEELAREFGTRIAHLVSWLSEQKHDAQGQKRPWEIRKQEHAEKLRQAPVAAKAIALADKLHNLHSVLEDLQAGRPVWSRFNAPRERWLWNAARMIEACDGDDPRLRPLVEACQAVLAAVQSQDALPPARPQDNGCRGPGKS